MYETYYGLREKPFSILPDPDLIYWCQNHRLAFAMLEFGVMNSAGFTVITGEIGAGKTTLVRYLLRKLDHHVTACLVPSTPRGQDGLLPWLMMSLNIPFEGSYPALFKQFRDYLYDQHSRQQRTIIIVDEAQNLGYEALEELRMLSNVNAEKKQLLQIILVGQPQLRDMLRAPQLLQFAQRISSDFHLRPLNAREAMEYIGFRLSCVGAQSELFSDAASRAIAEISGGVPRTINILCDTALVYGFAAQAKVITADIVSSVVQNREQFGVVPFGLQPV
jgi:type II secretory pathway predicted ATPase ExeA